MTGALAWVTGLATYLCSHLIFPLQKIWGREVCVPLYVGLYPHHRHSRDHFRVPMLRGGDYQDRRGCGDGVSGGGSGRATLGKRALVRIGRLPELRGLAWSLDRLSHWAWTLTGRPNPLKFPLLQFRAFARSVMAAGLASASRFWWSSRAVLLTTFYRGRTFGFTLRGGEKLG